MLLKSDGFSSTLYDPGEDFTLKRYCEERGIVYADLGTPVRLEVFCAYGLAFQKRFAPNLERKRLISLEQARAAFTLHLSNEDSFFAKRVVIATGLSHFERVPPQLAALPEGLLSHSSAHADLGPFKGRDVTVIGGGASATELATLLHEIGSKVRMVVRRPSVELQSRMQLPRPIAQKIRRPMSPIAHFTDLPLLFHHLPVPVQNRLVQGFLGAAGGWFLRGRFDSATVNSFGPVVRFAAGARFTARHLSNYLARTSRVAN